MERRKLLKSFLFYNILLVLATAFFLIIYLLSEKFDLHLLDCALYNRLEIYCPGCGGTRALLSLLRLDFLKSFLYYPPLILTVAVLGVCEILNFLSIISGNMIYSKRFRYGYFIIIPASVLLSYAVRITLLFCGIDFMPV